MTNVTYVLSFIDKSVSFEWIIETIDKKKIKLSFILLNNKNSEIENYLKVNNVNFLKINYSGKKDIVKALFKCGIFFIKNKTKVVHTHLFDASLIGLLAAKLVLVRRRIHTRHNATIHHVYHPKAVKYDKFINFLSTDIVAISENVREILINIEQVNPVKIKLIHHGFKLEEFRDISTERIEDLKSKFDLTNDTKPVIGVISRYIHWKGIQYIIPAFKDYLKHFPNAHLILANADGPYASEIKLLLSSLPKNTYTEIQFENDLFALYKLFDIFIHAPIDKDCEAFGQIYIEALASKVPSIFTMSGIAADFIKDNFNALVVPFKNSNAILNRMLEISKNDLLEETLKENGYKSIQYKFTLNKMIINLEKLYE
jgi:glycosyltransferase involved in cell wall biosynthesis